MGYSVVHVANIAPAGPGGALRFADGARPGSYEARGPY